MAKIERFKKESDLNITRLVIKREVAFYDEYKV